MNKKKKKHNKISNSNVDSILSLNQMKNKTFFFSKFTVILLYNCATLKNKTYLTLF